MNELKKVNHNLVLKKFNPNIVFTSQTAPVVYMSTGLLIGSLSILSILSPFAILGAFGMPVASIFMITGLAGFMVPNSLKTKKNDSKEVIVLPELKNNPITSSSARENTPILPVTLFGENK